MAARADLDVNQATEAELDSVRGIGPGLSHRILQERERRSFQNWGDLVARVSGIGQATATRLSQEGLTVNGESFASTEKASSRQRKRNGAAPAPSETVSPAR